LSKLDHSIEEYIQRKPRLALAKMAGYISSITFIISDVIGLNDKTKKHCSLTLSLHRMQNIIIDKIHAALNFAIDRVIQKANRSVSRKLSS
jgi:hypothetical protein